jgi:hypothetical protein
MSTVAELCSLVDDLTAVVIGVTRREMRAAARALAAAIRDRQPTASAVRLTDSDQGDWLDAEEWLCRDTGEWGPIELDVLDEVGHLASHLYLPHLDAVPGLAVTDGRAGRGARYTLALDEILGTTEQRALVEVLIVRDPDGPTAVTTAVAGVAAAPLGVQETHVDAGAGWQCEDWTRHREQALQGASEVLYDAVVAAFSDPPGGQYVEGRDERPWLPQGR